MHRLPHQALEGRGPSAAVVWVGGAGTGKAQSNARLSRKVVRGKK